MTPGHFRLPHPGLTAAPWRLASRSEADPDESSESELELLLESELESSLESEVPSEESELLEELELEAEAEVASVQVTEGT